MSFLNFIYPRTVSVSRIDLSGGMGYEEINYLPITDLANLQASIQFKSTGSKPNTNLPADASNDVYWAIFIPFSQSGLTISRGLILLRDLIIDDLGARYEVVGAYWNSLGYQLRAKLLAP